MAEKQQINEEELVDLLIEVATTLKDAIDGVLDSEGEDYRIK